MLTGKKVLITGASSGIGRSTAIILTKEGAQVCGVGRNEEALKLLVEEGHLHSYVVGDLDIDGECERIVKEGVAKLGSLSTLINVAGVLVGGAMQSVGLDNYLRNFRTNVQATFEMMQHAIPHLQEYAVTNPAHASIVNVSSVNGKQAFGGCVNYCAAKAAVDQLTRCASVDLASLGIRVNSVNPGVVSTPLQKRGGMSDENYDKFIERSVSLTHPLAKVLGRIALPEEVGDLITFLVSDKGIMERRYVGDNSRGAHRQYTSFELL